MQQSGKHYKQQVAQADRVIARASKMLGAQDKRHMPSHVLVRGNDKAKDTTGKLRELGLCGTPILLGDDIRSLCKKPQGHSDMCATQIFVNSTVWEPTISRALDLEL